MRFSSSALVAIVVLMMMMEQGTAFVRPQGPLSVQQQRTLRSRHFMAMDMPPSAPAAAVNLPVIQANQYGPSDVRYSDFLKLVTADRIEKVTFSADGSQLLGVDVDGARVKIESLPNDPDLLTQLTSHKVSGINFLYD
jgi:cell division protease FtsH